jgi:hypothetical protein
LQQIKEHHKRVMLDINMVHKVHLTNFILEASNDISTAEVTHTIHQGVNHNPEPINPHPNTYNPG